MGALRPMVAVLLAALNSVVTGEFQFEVEVVEFHDSVDDCGILLDVCVLYINEMCLDAGSEEPQEECSLGDLDLRSGLPKRKTFSVISQPWPVDVRLCIEVMDYDLVSDDDHIEDLLVLTSLNTSSEFTEPAEFNADGRITLTLRFRVQCSGGYEGPRCSCVPRDDDENGHYSCREEGGISCLPGYTNTSNLCRQEHCAGVVCPSNGTCVNNSTSFSCEEPPPPPTSPTTTSSIAPKENCNCASGMACIEKEGQFSCVCAEGFTGEDCGTVTTSPHQQDRGPAMPAAFVAAIVAGVLVAGLLSALLVVAIVVWIRCRRRRQCKFGTKVSSRGGGPVPLKLPLSLAGQGKVVSNPTYSNPSAAEAGSNDGDTLRHMPNPLYTHSNVENPLYREHPPQREGIYSVPHCSPTSPTASQEDTQATGGGMYSEPDVEKVGDVSYATVGPAGGKDPAAIEGGEYARPTGPPRYSEAPYDTLDHGVQSHHHTHPPLAGYSTLNHHTHPPMARDHHTHPPLAGYSTLNQHKH